MLSSILIIIAVLVVMLIFVYIGIGGVLLGNIFGDRMDKNPDHKYITAEEKNLDTEFIRVQTKKGFLRGRIYTSSDMDRKDTKKDKIIVFGHGIGPGCCAYMTEIAYLCNLGYTVVGVDFLGCGESEGKNARGFYSAAIGLRETAKKIKRDERYAGRKIILVGHSWGAYGAICAQAETKVDAVVAISAPDSPINIVPYAIGTKMPKFILYAERLVWRFLNRVRFGKLGNTTCAKAAAETDTPMLLIHGEKDTTVPLQLAAIYTIPDDRAEKELEPGKKHNPYNTPEAEEQLEKLRKATKFLSKRPKTECEDFYGKFDFDACVVEDEDVMDLIGGYIDQFDSED